MAIYIEVPDYGRDKSKPLQKTVAREGKLLLQERNYIESPDPNEVGTVLISRYYEYNDKKYLIYVDENYNLKFPNMEADELDY